MKIIGNALRRVDIIPERFWFVLVEENGIYSVYHYLDGSYGQKNFGEDKTQAEIHLDNQACCRDYYQKLIAKRTKLISRIAPIRNKLDATTTIISALILR